MVFVSFIHQVTASYVAVVNPPHYFKTTVFRASAQVFRRYETAGVYVGKVYHVYHAGFPAFAESERVFRFRNHHLHVIGGIKDTVRFGICLGEKLAHAVFRGYALDSETFGQDGMQFRFWHFFSSALHSACFENGCMFQFKRIFLYKVKECIRNPEQYGRNGFMLAFHNQSPYFVQVIRIKTALGVKASVYEMVYHVDE